MYYSKYLKYKKKYVSIKNLQGGTLTDSKNSEPHKFYIYTMGIGDGQFYDNNSARNWINCDILSKILDKIPANYTDIEIIHSDPLYDYNGSLLNIPAADIKGLNDELYMSDIKKGRVTNSKFIADLLDFENIQSQNHLIFDLGHIMTHVGKRQVTYKISNVYYIIYNLNVISCGYIGDNPNITTHFILMFDSQIFKFEEGRIVTYINKLFDYNMITDHLLVDEHISINCRSIISMLNARWIRVREGFEAPQNFIIYIKKFYIYSLMASNDKSTFDKIIKDFTDRIPSLGRIELIQLVDSQEFTI